MDGGGNVVNNHATWLKAREATYAEAPPVPEEFPTPATTKMGRVARRVDMTADELWCLHNALALYTEVVNASSSSQSAT